MKTVIRIATKPYEFFEVTGDETDIPKMLELQRQYSDNPMTAGSTKRLTDLFGNSIDYDETNHIYSWKGEVYESGSQFAKKNQKPFDPVMMSGMVAKKTGADPLEIAKLWERGGKISRDFGTTVHEALEVYGKFKSLSDSLEKEYHLPNHPVLRDIVESFYKDREHDAADYEVLVVDHKAKRAGTIDRLLHGPAPKSATIEDFKITHKDDKQYWADQLGFYETILKANGWTVTGKVIHKYSDKWEEIAV